VTDFQRQLAYLILSDTDFTADDLTNNGAIALDSGHTANALQNGIGSIFSRSARQGLISFTGNVRRSNAPHRKGGAIRVWRGTDAGKRWARQVLDDTESLF
jgi:photosystem II stability/assembly factor-like uncharacterized protein